MLTEELKSKHMGAALMLFECYDQEGNNVLEQILLTTRDETGFTHHA
jgi:hypothetical protein